MEKIYLVDFDGTITKKDTLDFLARKFYPEESKVWGKRLMNGEITVAQWLKAFEIVFNVPEEEYDRVLLENIEIDETFIEFAQKNKVAIVSGGFDYNIEKILAKYDIKNIEIYANKLTFVENDRVKIEMNHYNHGCEKCGVCKKGIMEEYKKTYETVAFIGDGITDLCVSTYSDEVYAKKGTYLEKYLTEKGIVHTTFDKFEEI